eukprot:878709-Prymnesium_polylepis.2
MSTLSSGRRRGACIGSRHKLGGGCTAHDGGVCDEVGAEELVAHARVVLEQVEIRTADLPLSVVRATVAARLAVDGMPDRLRGAGLSHWIAGEHELPAVTRADAHARHAAGAHACTDRQMSVELLDVVRAVVDQAQRAAARAKRRLPLHVLRACRGERPRTQDRVTSEAQHVTAAF